MNAHSLSVHRNPVPLALDFFIVSPLAKLSFKLFVVDDTSLNTGLVCCRPGAGGQAGKGAGRGGAGQGGWGWGGVGGVPWYKRFLYPRKVWSVSGNRFIDRKPVLSSVVSIAV